MWSLNDALTLYRDILAPLAQEHGFSAALYGSVLRNGTGNDLDVFMVPQSADANADSLLEALSDYMKAVAGPEPGDWNRRVTVVTTHSRQRIDIQFLC